MMEVRLRETGELLGLCPLSIGEIGQPLKFPRLAAMPEAPRAWPSDPPRPDPSATTHIEVMIEPDKWRGASRGVITVAERHDADNVPGFRSVTDLFIA